jgi:hypothetical protein
MEGKILGDLDYDLRSIQDRTTSLRESIQEMMQDLMKEERSRLEFLGNNYILEWTNWLVQKLENKSKECLLMEGHINKNSPTTNVTWESTQELALKASNISRKGLESIHVPTNSIDLMLERILSKISKVSLSILLNTNIILTFRSDRGGSW